MPLTAKITDCDSDNVILNKKAVQNETTSKPPTIWSQTIIIMAFITNKNKPNENIVIGKVNSMISGFTNKLSKPNTIATNMAVVMLAIIIPGINLEIMMAKIAVMSILYMIFMRLLF